MLDIFFDQLGEILGVMLVAATTMVMAWLRRKLQLEKLHLTTAQEAWLRAQAREIALLVEERHAGGRGSIKLDEATISMTNRAALSGRALTDQAARDLIESVLPELGLGRSATTASGS